METREFHFTEGSSRKFWRISRTEHVQTVQYGRIDSAGQTQVKTFPDAEAAREAGERLIAEKLKKGYTEMTAGPASPTEIIVPPAKSVPTTAAPQPVTPAITPSEPAPVPTAPSAPAPAPSPESRRIDLDPLDWYWATWRNLPPLPRPAPTPFDLEVALARLARLKRGNWHSPSRWDQADIGLVHSHEAARFWLYAMGKLDYRISPADLAKQIKKSGLVPADDESLARSAMNFSLSDYTSDFVVVPLVNLLSLEGFIQLWLQIEEENPRRSAHKMTILSRLLVGLRTWVLPYLSGADRAALHPLIRESLHQAEWPSIIDGPLHPAFYLAACLGMHAEVLDLVQSWTAESVARSEYSGYVNVYDRAGDVDEIVFGLGSPELVEHHYRRLDLRLLNPVAMRAWLATTEYAALDIIRDSILVQDQRERVEAMMQTFSLVHAPEAAPHMLALLHASRAPRLTREWLEAHPAHTIAGLVPVAAGTGPHSPDALAFLLRLQRRGFDDLIASALDIQALATDHPMRAALSASAAARFRTFDAATTPDWLRGALASVPSVSAPSWVIAADLPPITVGVARLSDEQAGRLLRALQKSALDAPHPLVIALKQHANRAGLDAFAWTLFQLWLAEGAPSKENWAMRAVGLLGDDSSAVRLAPLIRVWPGESQHQRAVLGLECLRAIGTDVALMQIHAIAQKVQFKAIQSRARECLEAIARDRSLTRGQLEDRLVPDFDLDARGSRSFDFGPRQFRLALGPDLKPWVKDQSGAQRPDLPKPTTKDHAELANAAQAEWKTLKKGLSETARLQALRLEDAMVTGRHWTPGEFDLLIAQHPLMGLLAQRLIWATYDATGTLTGTFRLTEDRTLADMQDDACVLPESAMAVGIVHPLHLDAATRQAWGEILADYTIVPPFPQLGRAIHHLEPAERQATVISRFAAIAIDPKAMVFGLEKLGWTRGVSYDNGVFDEHIKPFQAANVTAVVQYKGAAFGLLDAFGDLQLERCWFLPGLAEPVAYRTTEGAIPLDQVDPLVISEVLADLTSIAAKGK